MPRVALVATMRDEGPFILEWVAYHRLIGFGEVVVCSNDCVDDSPMLLDALQDQGLVRHLRCTPAADEKAQIVAYRQAAAVLAPHWPDAVMVLDADEFLNIHVGDGRVPALLAAVPDATAFLVNWRIFGSSGYRRWSAEPVLRRFVRAAGRESGVNWPYKTLFTRPDAYHCPLLPHGPGFARAECIAGLRAVDGDGATLPERYARSEEFLQSEPGTVSWGLAQVNHYNTRSWVDYLAKHTRGAGERGMSERFTFGIPLIARAVAHDWPLVEHLFGLTLRSVLAQTDRDLHVILAAHDVPAPWRALMPDARFEVVQADWPAEPPTAANDDGGAKKWLIKQRVRAEGGGLLMFLDADDWVSRNLVASARSTIAPDDVGGVLTDGVALDWQSLRVSRFPIVGAFAGPFHGLCGSSTIGRVVPHADDPMLLDPHLALGSHHGWPGAAAARGVSLARIDARAVYMVGSGQNHSERAGPFAAWRHDVTTAVRCGGAPLDQALAYEFGQELDRIEIGAMDLLRSFSS